MCGTACRVPFSRIPRVRRPSLAPADGARPVAWLWLRCANLMATELGKVRDQVNQTLATAGGQDTSKLDAVIEKVKGLL